MPTVIEIANRLRSIRVVIRIANINPGNESTTSKANDTTWSRQLLKKPAIIPRLPPITIPKKIAVKPTVSETRAPQIVRENMSRASLSVPNQNSEDGEYGGRPRLRSTKFWSGSLIGSHGASNAASTISTNQPIAIQNSGPSLRLTVPSAVIAAAWASIGDSVAARATSSLIGAPGDRSPCRARR